MRRYIHMFLIGVAKCWQVATCTSQSRLTSTIKICHFNATLRNETHRYISMLRRLHIQPQSSRTCTATPEFFVSCSRLPANEYVLGPRMNMFQPHNRKGPTMIVSICSCGGSAVGSGMLWSPLLQQIYLSRRMRKLQVRLRFCLSISLPLFWYRSPTILVSSWLVCGLSYLWLTLHHPPKSVPLLSLLKRQHWFFGCGGIVFPRNPDKSA